MPAGNKAGYGKYNDIMPRMRDGGGDNIRAMTGRPATMDEGQRQYMLDQGNYTGANMAQVEQGATDDQQPSRSEMIMQGSPNDYLQQDPYTMGPGDSPFKGFADYISQRQQNPEAANAAADAETLNRVEAMNMMMQQQGLPQETDQRGAYLKALQESLRNSGMAER